MEFELRIFFFSAHSGNAVCKPVQNCQTINITAAAQPITDGKDRYDVKQNKNNNNYLNHEVFLITLV